jgi:predicted acetyltransferase
MVADRVEQVTADEVLPLKRRHVLDALMQLYLHDFSEYASLSTSHGEVGEDGRFDHFCLDTYWHEPGRVPLLVRADGRIAGFVLVNQWSALDRPLDHAIAEFFVLRKYRHARVGTRAAHLVFRQMPGRWEVPVASYNPGALAFWRGVVASLPREVEERVGDGQRWAGTVLCFDTGCMGPGRTTMGL